MSKKIAIIGGGASGLVSAITAARLGASVTVYERADRVGKKILVTGNGRCNLGNINLSPECYNHPDFVETVFSRFGMEKTLEFFRSVGVLTVSDGEGRIYPRTKEASTVLNALRRECDGLGVTTVTGSDVKEIKRRGNCFSIAGECFDSVILASGGGSARLCEGLAHKVTEEKPSLTAVVTDKKYLKGLNGKRVEATVTLSDGNSYVSERGEVLFREYGLSGIAVFNHSARINRKKGQYKILLDVVPELTEGELANEIEKRGILLGEENLEGVVNRFMAMNVLRETEGLPWREKNIARLLKALPFTVLGLRAEGAQVTSGGVDLAYVKENLESRIVKGLYFAGEILDIDGLCGGYNLQWAWSSGAVAGEEACRD